jgi:hypothetical protein
MSAAKIQYVRCDGPDCEETSISSLVPDYLTVTEARAILHQGRKADRWVTLPGGIDYCPNCKPEGT